MDVAGADLPENEARGLLSSVGLPGRTASDVPITLLSGGQKVRLALAKLLWKPPHFLILDEVTTHLDSDTILALAQALRKYEGTVLVITHDRFFMRCVVEGESLRSIARQGQEIDDEDESEDDSGQEDDQKRRGSVYHLSKGVLRKLEGGMQQYEEKAAKMSSRLAKFNW